MTYKETSIIPEVDVGIHFHARHGTLKLPQHFYLLIAQHPGHHYQVWSPYYQRHSATRKHLILYNLAGQVWESHKKLSININHSYHQNHLSLNWSNASDSVLTNPIEKDRVQDLSLWRRPACQTLSKILDISSTIPQVAPGLLKALVILSNTTARRYAVDSKVIKPNW